jgi:ubiquinone/menaquinone biosynthesis C-methylase UbiE
MVRLLLLSKPPKFVTALLKGGRLISHMKRFFVYLSKSGAESGFLPFGNISIPLVDHMSAKMREKIYPDSGVELTTFISRNYDRVMNIGSFGFYNGFIRRAIAQMQIEPDDDILDMGCGTGRNALLMNRYLGENGTITGLDISQAMEKQFLQKFRNDEKFKFINQRIDENFDLARKFDKVFISFVIHGFPHEVRTTVIQNAFNHLKPGGNFIILDFAEFDMEAMPFLHRWLFTTIECKYAFDFIRRDWKALLSEAGFSSFTEHFHLKKYVRLLKAMKPAI